MKTPFLQILVLLITVSNFIFSQEKNGEIVVSKTADLKEVLKSELQYIDSVFSNGYVYHNSGKVLNGKLNYHLLNDEVHFISPEKKKLAISSDDINFVSFNKHIFIYNPNFGYFEVAFNGTIKLLVKRRILVKEKDFEYVGAYGERSSSASVGRVDRMKGGDNVDQKVVRIKNAKSFDKIVDKKFRETLKEYIKKENINIENSDDLKKLTKWINTLKE